jgi:hypothetical protein
MDGLKLERYLGFERKVPRIILMQKSRNFEMTLSCRVGLGVQKLRVGVQKLQVFAFRPGVKNENVIKFTGPTGTDGHQNFLKFSSSDAKFERKKKTTLARLGQNHF